MKTVFIQLMRELKGAGSLRTGMKFLFFYIVLFSALFVCNNSPLCGAGFQVTAPKITVPDTLKWDADVSTGLNLSQTAYSNWTKGGESALAWVFSNKSRFVLNAKKYITAIETKFLYGKTKIGGNEARKSEDRINVEVMVQNKKPIISLFGSMTAETQFDVGKQYTGEGAFPVSNFIDPLYLYQTVGAVYNYEKYLQVRLGISFKETVTRKYLFWSDNPNTRKKEKARIEQGLDLRIKAKVTVMTNLNYSVDTKIFSTLESYLDTDMEFDNMLSAKVNKYIVVNLHYHLIYDRNASKKAQISEGLALGLTFNLW